MSSNSPMPGIVLRSRSPDSQCKRCWFKTSRPFYAHSRVASWLQYNQIHKKNQAL